MVFSLANTETLDFHNTPTVAPQLHALEIRRPRVDPNDRACEREVARQACTPVVQLAGGSSERVAPLVRPQLRSAPPDSQAWLRESSIGTLKRSHNPKCVPLAGKVCDKCV